MKETDILNLIYEYNACYAQDEQVVIDFLDRIAKDQITKDDFEGLKGVWLLNILYIIASDDVRKDMRHNKIYVYMHNKAVKLIHKFAEDVKLFNRHFTRGFAIPERYDKYVELLAEYPRYSKYIFNGIPDYYMKFGFLKNLTIDDPINYSTLYDGHVSKKMKLDFHSALGKVSLKKLEDLTKVMAQCRTKKELDICVNWKAVRIYNLTKDDRYKRPFIPYNERKYATRDGHNEDGIEELVEKLNRRRRDQGINDLIVIDNSDGSDCSNNVQSSSTDEVSSQISQSGHTDFNIRTDGYTTDRTDYTDFITEGDYITDGYSTDESSDYTDYSSHTDHTDHTDNTDNTDSVAKGDYIDKGDYITEGDSVVYDDYNDYTDYSGCNLSETSRSSRRRRSSETDRMSETSGRSGVSRRSGRSSETDRMSETSGRSGRSRVNRRNKARVEFTTNEDIEALEHTLGKIMDLL
jgi:hypothetical protein